MKYTLADYKNDLIFADWIEKNSPDLDSEIIENRIDRGERIILLNDHLEDVEILDERNELILKNISNQESLILPNIQLLRRSYFNLDKFRSLLKIENILEEDDDYSGPLILIWTQLEHEYKNRFFMNFIPENKSVIFFILDKYSKSKYAFFKEAISNNYKVTFGMISVLLFAIEKGIKTGERETLLKLSNILAPAFTQFFNKWSLSVKLSDINKNIRNSVIHENELIDYDLYYNICNELFDQEKINHWCTSKSPGLFGEYLKILPQL